ncbi:MAG: flagellar basal body rod protein FlgC [Planctomycetes bacterium]|nr:flagellar basal body rod protein FlgC [Planctomycetota bacterium]
MDINNIFQGLSVSASALRAERTRMGLIAQNLAQASVTNRGDGTPYRRKEVVFESVLDGALAGGVQVAEVVEDNNTPMVRQYRPGHADADANGMVTLPNVNTAFEMVDLMQSARAYEANLEAMQVQVRMAEKALDLGR